MRQGDDPAIVRVRLSDRQVEVVASLKGIRLAGRLAGIALSPMRVLMGTVWKHVLARQRQ